MPAVLYKKPKMMNKEDKNFPELNNENSDRDKVMKDELNETVDINDLTYNEEDGSYEIDMKSDDPEYDHPDPYKTSVKNGGDSNSDYDEANAEALDHYVEDPDKITDEYGMHIDNGSIVELDPVDELLAQTPEDQRDDLDEEGYPKNDADISKGDNDEDLLK